MRRRRCAAGVAENPSFVFLTKWGGVPISWHPARRLRAAKLLVSVGPWAFSRHTSRRVKLRVRIARLGRAIRAIRCTSLSFCDCGAAKSSTDFEKFTLCGSSAGMRRNLSEEASGRPPISGALFSTCDNTKEVKATQGYELFFSFSKLLEPDGCKVAPSAQSRGVTGAARSRGPALAFLALERAGSTNRGGANASARNRPGEFFVEPYGPRRAPRRDDRLMAQRATQCNTDHGPLTNNTNYKYKDGNQPCS